MPFPNFEKESPSRTEGRAAILVDYENLYSSLNDRLSQDANPDEFITAMIEETRRLLLEEDRMKTALVYAYADFTGLRGNGQFIQRALYLQGAEPRFVPAQFQRNASEVQLIVDAVDLLHTRSDIRTLVLLTGDRLYLPLVQQFRRSGLKAFVATLELPPRVDDLPFEEEDLYLDAANLLPEAGRRQLLSSNRRERRSGLRRQPTVAREHHPLNDGDHRKALETIEEYFGQYEEVYLTPLLRKLSETYPEHELDPKTVISELEDAGAVSLEKRRGFPYDYTVLIVDDSHPGVARIQEEYYGSRSDDFEDGYDYEDDEDYPADEFEEDFEDDLEDDLEDDGDFEPYDEEDFEDEVEEDPEEDLEDDLEVTPALEADYDADDYDDEERAEG